jgi:cell division protein FtsL
VRHVFRKKNPFLIFLRVMLVLLPVVLIFAIIWLRSNIVAVEYELGQLEKQKRALRSERIQLVAEKAELTSLDKIERLAVRRFGLAYTDRKKVVFVRETPQPAPFSAGFGENR